MPPLIGSSRFMFTRQGSRNARQLTAEKKMDKQVRPTERLTGFQVDERAGAF